MSERGAFFGYVRDAFVHLHDLPYLRTHPLTKLLAVEGRELSGEALRSRLLTAIEQLKPPTDAPPHSVSWRRYRYLHLRYAQGASHKAIANELVISIRQARRDHLDALKAVSSILEGEQRPSSRVLGERDPVLSGAGHECPEALGPRAALDAELSQAKFPEESRPTDFGEVLASVVGLASRLAQRLAGSVEVAATQALPPAAVDRTILRQILLTLLSYVIELEPGARIAVTATSGRDAIELEVTTREPSDPLARQPLAVGQSNGPMALLAAGRHLARLHGVRVEVSSQGVRPPCIRVSVPAVRPRTVLVVDDNPDVARLFDRYLRGSGYRLLKATTWQRALQLADKAQPDVITLDVMMPSQDGWDVLQRLREHPKTRAIPVVVCSVLPERSLAFAAGASGFLAKPVTRQRLLAALGEALSSHQARISLGG